MHIILKICYVYELSYNTNYIKLAFGNTKELLFDSALLAVSGYRGIQNRTVVKNISITETSKVLVYFQ